MRGPPPWRCRSTPARRPAIESGRWRRSVAPEASEPVFRSLTHFREPRGTLPRHSGLPVCVSRRSVIMKKTIAAVTAGLLLVSGQALAAGQSSVSRVGDRVGPQAGESSEFAGIPLIGILAAAGVLAAVVAVASADDSESD